MERAIVPSRPSRASGYRRIPAAPDWVKPSRWEKAIAKVAPRRAREMYKTRVMMELAQYRGSEIHRLRAGWLTSEDDITPDNWELNKLRERSRDLNRNDPVASGATETMAMNIVGQGLRPQARIRADYLNVSEDRAKEIQRQAENVWSLWTPNADAANKLDFSEIQFLALRKIIEDGETIAIPIMADEKWRPIKRAIELVESDRLAMVKGATPLTGDTGIDVGDRGQPIKYHITKEADGPGKLEEAIINARDSRGRLKVLHVFPTKRPGQLRGIPYFAPVLTHFKDLADYMEAEIVAARVAACLAVFITKEGAFDMPTANATDTETSTNAKIQSIEPGLIGYLNPGENINVVEPKRPGDSFEPFIEGLLRMIGMALGIPYEILAKDFSKTNYSSARAALLEGRRMFTTWRSWFSRKFCQVIYDLVLEEAFLRGLFDVPEFYRYRTEYTRAVWIGGSWGWVDPVKEVEASRKAIDYGLSTLAEEAAGQGRDWEEIMDQQAREYAQADKKGVPIMRSNKQDDGTYGQDKTAQ